MAFQVFGAVALALAALLDRRKDGGARGLGAFEVPIDVADVNQHAVDDVRHVVPAPRRFTFLAVPFWPAVVGRWSGKHDQATPRLHLAVAEPAPLAQHAGALAKTERSGEPVHRGGTVLVSDHRYDGRIFAAHAASSGLYSPNTSRSTRQHSPIVAYSDSAAFSGGIRFSTPRAARSRSANFSSTSR